MSDSISPLGHLNRGIFAYRTEDIPGARSHFAAALQSDSSSELAWIWFATVSDDYQEQRYCINRALAINPESVARTRMEHLTGVSPKVPAELAELDQPVLPPDLQKLRADRRVHLPLVNRRHKQSAPTDKSGETQPEPPDPPTPLAERDRKKIGGPWRWLTLGIVLLLTIGGLAFAVLQPDPEPYRIALVVPQTGDFADRAEEQVRAAELTVDQINELGGIRDHKIELVVFDDGNEPDQAVEVAERIVADDRILLVIGHNDSGASLAAGDIYRDAGIPAITMAAAADAVTAENEWFFGVVVPTSGQGNFVAGYATTVLGADRVSVVRSDDTYATTLANSFGNAFEDNGGSVANTWDIDEANAEASVARIVEEIGRADDPGTIFLALQLPETRAMIRALRDANVDVPILLAPAMGFDDFPDYFEELPQEVETRGYYTNGIYSASPMIYDSIGGRAVQFADAFRERYDTSPDWFGAKVYDAITIGVAAIDRSGIEPGGNASEMRREVRDALAAIDSPETAVQGPSSPLYFTSERRVPQSLSVGRFRDGHIYSEPIQYALVTDPSRYDHDADREAGLLMEMGDDSYRQYRVVYIGMDINEVSELATSSQTYTADFFVWMRYTGGVSATDIVFTNATDPSLGLGDPLQETTTGDVTYAMFRVHGTFSEPMDFHNYPWDRHELGVGFQNQKLNDDDIVYVADAATLGQSQEERLLSGTDVSRPFNEIPNWQASRVWFSQSPQLSRSVAIDEATQSPGYTQFSEFQVDVLYSRDVQSFLIKNLLPLGLLALVTYISLFFPAEQAGARTGFAITSILTSSVLLGSISSRLPDIGYTVAIEWGFYVYIALSTVLVLFNILVERLHKAKRYSVVRRLDVAARVLYPTAVLGVILIYASRFA